MGVRGSNPPKNRVFGLKAFFIQALSLVGIAMEVVSKGLGLTHASLAEGPGRTRPARIAKGVMGLGSTSRPLLRR